LFAAALDRALDPAGAVQPAPARRGVSVSKYPISTACPDCGSADYRKRRFSRECRVCRTHYRPPTPSWHRWTIGLGLFIPGLFCGGVAAACAVGIYSLIPAKGDPGGVAGAFDYICLGVCLGVPGALGVAGLLLCVGRGLKELLAREVITPPGVPPPGGPRQVTSVRMVPEGEAEALLRMVAQQHHESAILRQLGPFGSERLAGPVTMFPSPLYFVVSSRSRSTPSERLAGAVRSFAREWDPDEIPLLFLDTSWQRNGRAGVLLTNRRLYSSRLDGPIELQDVTRVVFKDPSDDEMTFKVLLFVICLLVGAIVILLGPWFRRRLVVNREVVYEGRVNIHTGFWVDLLTTLGDAARQAEARPDLRAEWARHPGVTALELFPHSAEGVPLADERVDAPSWDQVERSIRTLDGHAHPQVRLWVGRLGEATGLEIIGGRGKYALREVGDGWVYYDPNGADEEVVVQTSGAGHRCAGYYVCTDVERVLRIARRFFESGAAGDDD
jgi:hypothetical protein